MPRYFFHIHHRGEQPDKTGADFASDKEARKQGVAAFSEFMHDLDGQMDDGAAYRTECIDEAGRKVFTIHISTETYFDT